MNQLYIYIYPLPLRPPSTWPYPTPVDQHRALSWDPCALAGSHQLSVLPLVVYMYTCMYGLPWWLRGKESLEMQETVWSAGDEPFPGLGRSPGEGNGYPLQYSWEFHGRRKLMVYSPWGSLRVGHNLTTKPSHCCIVNPNLPVRLALPLPSWVHILFSASASLFLPWK